MHFARHLLRPIPALIGLVWMALSAQAVGQPALTVLHTFGVGGPGGLNPDNEKNSGGARPTSPLTQGRDGALYGAASSGGVHGTGVLFKIAPDGSGFTVVHSFGRVAALFMNQANSDGATPHGALVQGSDGALYGAAYTGGTGGGGTIFRVSTDGTGFRVLRAFAALRMASYNQGGNSPVGLTLERDGMLYGVTLLGGWNGQGTVFKMGIDGRGFKTLHEFHETTPRNNVNDDGARPAAAPVLGRDGALYGTTNIGGKFGDGVLYRLATDGKRFDVLHRFQRSGAGFAGNGVFPQGVLTQGSDGFLYGSARQGGAYDGGILFKVGEDGTGFTVLHTFSDPRAESVDGSLPSATPVFGEDGQLYGVASAGGAGGMGTVFRVIPDGSKFFLLHEFSAPDGKLHNTDGGFTQAGLMRGRDGAFYGVTTGGGLNGNGIVFRLAMPQVN